MKVSTTARKPRRAVALFGTELADGKSRRLAAGPLTAELDNGALRYIRIAGVEVLRAIAFLVRDENWGTFASSIAGLKVKQGRDEFRVTYVARCGDGARDLGYCADIVGKADGTLRFECAATARTDFLTNRTGFVVLHPLQGVAGCPVEVEHVDGRKVMSSFPRLIEPAQPFLDIRALSHEVAPGVWATCRMEGDSFEMEDHRNWTDASFKTYVRPLALPWPYTIAAGTEFTQSVTLSVRGSLPRAKAAGAAGRSRVSLGEALGAAMPMLGLGVPAAEAAAPDLDLIRAARPRWLVCQVDLRRRHGVGAMKRYRRLAEATGAEAVLEIVLAGKRPPAEELQAAARDAAAAGLRPAGIAVSPAPDLKAVLPGSLGPPVPPLADIYKAARAAFRGVPLGGGMFSYFTELNRKRPPAELLDYVTHTTCPIVHAADDVSVMETLEALPYVIESTRAFIGRTAYRVGPSAIGCRDNPYGRAVSPNPGNGRVCLAEMDPRWRGLYGAAWTLGYIAAFAKGGVQAIAIGASTGPAGIVYRKAAYAQPYFDALRGPAVYPVYHVLAGLAPARGRKLLAAESDDPASLACLAYRSPRGPVLWLANLTVAERSVTLAGLGGPMTLRVLDEWSFAAAVADPAGFRAGGRRLARPTSIRLGAYALAWLEPAAK